MSGREPDTHGRVSRAWHSKQAKWGAVGVLGAALLVVIAVTVMGIVAPEDASSGGSDRSSADVGIEATPTTAAVDDFKCSDVTANTTPIPAVPSDLRYQPGVDGLSWPVSPTVGPTRDVDGFDACFAHSRIGAALAAVTAVYSQFDTRHPIGDALAFYIADGPGKQMAISETAAKSDPESMLSNGMTSAGFIVDSFSPDQAQITLVYTFPSSPTGYAGIPATMVWVGGDWKIRVLDDGELSAGGGTTPSKGDFIPWLGGGS
ncbi:MULTISPECIES: hypothetical protein [Clavibacter]|uniref:DUF8175 domain-containing protein n=2 Tax=Clavibacter TaxID=1573 RepID=A0A399NYS9_9MICO|nr:MULTISPECIES: hypothetical protein [Clavibacter]KDP89795.1 hypothetical protein W824_14980 [Clavibacter cf. michiganensis LMG 26808]RII99074.1 hypothetical protein DZF96_00060 [Clavibacter michiganensis]UKF26691.1 hypothetical protein KYT88_15860 [Clavibacter sp. A6099]